MTRCTFIAALVAAMLAFAACSSTKAIVIAPEPVAAPVVPPFEQVLRERLEQLRAPVAAPSDNPSTSTAAEDLRAAQEREATLDRELRAEYARSGALPLELVEQLAEARDARFDALYRTLVDDPSSALPEHVLASRGGGR